MDYNSTALKLHEKFQGKIETKLKTDIANSDDLSTVYSPWVAEPCREIAKDPEKAKIYTLKGNTVAVISDGSAVLWLGNIWAKASLPVMEGKCALFKKFADVNAFPIVLDTQDTEEIITTIKHIAPGLGGINLEDISAPRCFEIEERLKKDLDIPVFHDDQHGTAIVCLAGLINALKVVDKEKENIKVVVNGLWAAGTAIIKLLRLYGIKNIIALDSRGIISKARDNLNSEKTAMLDITNPEDISGTLADAMQEADVFLWVSAPWVLTQEMVRCMKKDPIIFAMANPDPEITPENAYTAGAKIVATGRSDYPNQINNVLVFPWIFRWALDAGVTAITDDMKIKAAQGLASFITHPSPDKIIPGPFEVWISEIIAKSVR